MKKLANKKEELRGASVKATKSAYQDNLDWLAHRVRRLCVLTLGLGSVFGLYWGGIQLLSLVDQPLKKVEIRGQFEHLDTQAIAVLVQERVDAGIVALDLTEIQKLLIKQPWVERVSVRRKWPNLLLIDMVERSPVVRWNEDALMTAKAEVFKPKADLERYQLPRLTGTYDSRKEILQQLGWLMAQFKDEGLVISELRKEQRGAWQILTTQGIHIELGNGDFEEKVKRFRGLYKNALSERIDEIEKIDLRYTHGAAVHWKASAKGEGIKQTASIKVSVIGEIARTFNGSSTA